MYPWNWIRIVAKALAKNPDERYQPVGEMLVDLRALRGGFQGFARGPGAGRCAAGSGPPRSPSCWLPAFFVWQAWRAPAGARRRSAPSRSPRYPGVQRYPSFSPDGNHVVFAWTGPKQDNPDIYVQQLGAGSPLRLTTDPSNDYNPVWSPDGRSVAFLRRRSGSRPE